MSKKPVWRVLGLLLSICPTGGCTIDPGSWGGDGPAYTLDPSKIGTGQPAITQEDDAHYWNGQSMDHHTRR